MFRKIISLPFRGLMFVGGLFVRAHEYTLIRGYRAANRPHFIHELESPRRRFFLNHGPYYCPYRGEFTSFTYY